MVGLGSGARRWRIIFDVGVLRAKFRLDRSSARHDIDVFC